MREAWHLWAWPEICVMMAQGPIPVWWPAPEGIGDTNLAAFMESFQASIAFHSNHATQLSSAFHHLKGMGSFMLPQTIPRYCMQGPLKWQQGKTGHPQRDLPLLQRISCTDPETFWAPVLRQLRIKFHTPPSRSATPLLSTYCPRKDSNVPLHVLALSI